MSVTAQDRAGNSGSAPPSLPPARSTAPPNTGVAARYLTGSGPLEPVRAGTVVRFRLGPVPRRSRWSLARLGSERPLARGRAAGSELALRVPRRARTGLHLLEVLAAGRRVTVPVVVRAAPGSARARPRVLVVLPTISWQGLNPFDADADGFSDTLDTAAAAALDRPLLPRGGPRGLATGEGALLRFLDRERLAYELTTDLALARAKGPRLAGHSGVLFAGSERWLSGPLGDRVRAYVDRGGRVASFGVDAFRRRVDVQSRRLSGPSPPAPVSFLGEATSPLRIAPAPMVVTEDRVGLFAGTDGFIGLFSTFERSDSLVPGARRVAAAGREAERPAFVAYRLGRGLVIRAGSREWGSQLAGRDDLARVTRRAWALLSR